jgi:uncharacterized repeat protein (TIGR03803 family)
MMWRRLSGLLVLAFVTGCGGSLAPVPPAREITPPGSSESFTIYAFQNTSGTYGLPVSPANDGAQPKGTLTLVMTGASPMLFGRTAAGGNATTCGAFFDLNPASPSSYSVIYRFSGSDGCSPRHDAMVLNMSGLLFSTTQGVNNDGMTVYNNGDIVTVTPATAAVSVFHQFAGQPSDGSQQHSSFSFDAGGDTFGMSADGGANDKGFLYDIPAGSSTPIGLHNFKKSDGEDPHGRIVLLGNTLWGITRKGGSNGLGVVFSLAVPSPLPTTSEDLSINIVHQFAGNGSDGAFSDHGYLMPVTQGGSTVLYGMTECGGTGNGGDTSSCSGQGGGDGVVFQIDPSSGKYNTFYQFQGNSNGDGADPYGSLLYDPTTNLLYGMTRNGGKSDQGTVFAIAPGAFGSHGSISWRYSFTGQNGDGANPIDNVILYNATLYGMTEQGGTGTGTVFAIPLP